MEHFLLLGYSYLLNEHELYLPIRVSTLGDFKLTFAYFGHLGAAETSFKQYNDTLSPDMVNLETNRRLFTHPEKYRVT